MAVQKIVAFHARSTARLRSVYGHSVFLLINTAAQPRSVVAQRSALTRASTERRPPLLGALHRS
jgi:hypothetical protein